MGLLDSVFGSIFGSKDVRDTNRANKDIAEVNTLTSGIQELFSEIESTLTTDQLSQFEEFVNQQEQMTQERGQQETTVLERGSAESQEALTNLIGELEGGTDAGAAMDAAIRRVLESGAPQVSNVLAQSGGFDNTTAALLQNDLITRAADAAAQVQLQQENTQNQQLLDAIAAGQTGTETTTRDLEEQLTGETTTDTTSTGEQQSSTVEQENTSETQKNVSQEFKDVSDAVAPPSGSALQELVKQGTTAENITDEAEQATGSAATGAGADGGGNGGGEGGFIGGLVGDLVDNVIQRQGGGDAVAPQPTTRPGPTPAGGTKPAPAIAPDVAAQELAKIQASKEGEGAGTAIEEELMNIANSANVQ